MHNDQQLLIDRVNSLIAELRSTAIDPFVLKIGALTDIEIRPLHEGDSVYIGHTSLGCTCVNYTAEGLILDVYSADESMLDPVFTQCIYQDDLEAPEHE